MQLKEVGVHTEEGEKCADLTLRGKLCQSQFLFVPLYLRYIILSYAHITTHLKG